jgi:hypothetical protein
MPCTLDWETKGVYVKFQGACTVLDLVHAFEAIGGDARSDDIHCVIFDFLDVASQNVTESEAEEIAAMDVGLAYSVPRLRFASVSTDERILELWRHFVSVHSMPERHGVFSSLEQARAWVANMESNAPPSSLPRFR